VPPVGFQGRATDIAAVGDLDDHRTPRLALVEGEWLRAARIDEPGAEVDPAGVVVAAEGEVVPALPDLGGREWAVDPLARRAAAGLGPVEEGEVDALPATAAAPAAVGPQDALQRVARPGGLMVAQPPDGQPIGELVRL
jgi:hypothetical protein